MFNIKSMRTSKAMRGLRVFRLALSGAIAGAALVGVVAPAWANAHGLTADAVGAGAGFATILLVKLTHLL